MTGGGLDQTKASSQQGSQNRDGSRNEDGVARLSSDLLSLENTALKRQKLKLTEAIIFLGCGHFE